MVNAAVYGGGLLTASGGNGTYAYRPARPAVREAAREMGEVCRRWGTDLATAALHFSLRDARVASTVTGFTKPSTLARTLEAVDADLPEQFWEEIEALVPIRSTGSTTTLRSSGDGIDESAQVRVRRYVRRDRGNPEPQRSLVR